VVDIPEPPRSNLKNKLALVSSLAAVVLATGCGPTTSPGSTKVPVGATVQTVAIDGEPRAFRVYRPKGLSTSAPLVIVLHGWGFTAEQIEHDYGWNDVAELHRFVVVHPEGVGLSWNAAGDCCGPAADSGVDDVAFITGMVERLKRVLPIDDRRIYAAGFSNGGVLAYALACRTSLFAAIGVVAGTQVGGCEDPRPTSVIHVHGMADSIVRFDGGRAVVPGARPVSQVMAYWRRANQCQKPNQSRRGPVVTVRAGCADDREVTLVTIDDEGHFWPGRAGSLAPWDATEELWKMFSRHSL
jgi:polyhydroxybutyrate depolymerase